MIGLARCLQPADQREQPRRLARRQRCRRLVEDDDAGIELQRLGDLDQLPLARRQALDQRLRRQVEIDLRAAARRCAARNAAAIDQSAAPRGMAPMKMFSAIDEVGKEVEFLVDEGDAAPLRLARVGGRVGRPARAALCRHRARRCRR